MTREEKVDRLEWYCDHYGESCNKCELKNMYDKEVDEFTDNHSCVFDEMDDKMLDKIYNWYKELGPAACENAETKCCDKETDSDMVNHYKNIVEEMRRLFDLFDGNVEIFINKSNKTIDISIPM
jgi:hypothetical protein